jgi:hypothetical protein
MRAAREPSEVIMPDEKDRTDEAPTPAEDLGLPTPPSPGRVPPPHLPPPPGDDAPPKEPPPAGQI